MQNLSISYEANNNVDFLYILSNTVIKPHIDRIRFSCRSEIDEPEKTLFSVIEKNFLKLHLYELKDNRIESKYSKYKRIRRYCNETDVKVSIVYERKNKFCCCPCMTINIYRPDLDIVNFFDAICNALGFLTTLNHVELAMDISPYSYVIEEFFYNHLFLKYNRGKNCFFGDNCETYYIGHKRKNSKSIIIYSKPKSSRKKNLLRVEFRFNRKFLKRLELGLDCLEKINNIDLRKLISFKLLNKQRLTNHILWSCKSQLSSLPEGERKQFERILNRYPFSAEGAVEQFSAIKESGFVDQYQRFFEVMNEVNEAFFGKLKGKRII